MNVNFRIVTISMVWLLMLNPSFSSAQSLLSAHPVEDQPPEMLAVINGDTISSADLEEIIISTHSAMDKDQKMSFDYRKLFDKLVNDRLIIQEASSLGLDEQPELVRMMDESRRDNSIRYFVRDKFKPDLSVSEPEIKAFFTEYYARMQLRTVCVKNKDDAAGMAAAVKAGADMDSLARAVSLDTYSYQGGLHNFKHWADIENVLRAEAVSLEPGEISSVFPYRQVYSFLRVEKKSPADLDELPLFSKKIKQLLTAQKQESAWRTFVDSLADKFPIILDSTALRGIAGDADKLYTANFTIEDETMAMTIDDKDGLTAGQLRKTISHTAMQNGDLTFDEILLMGLNQAREELVLSAAAANEGYLDYADVVKMYNHSYDSAMIEVYLKETIIPRIKFNSQEFQCYYDEHLEDFREPDQFQIDRMEVAAESTAVEIAERLAGGSDFEYIARQYGAEIATEEDRNQWLPLDILPSGIRENLENLQIGRTSQAFETLNGWMIFRIKARRPGQVRSLADVNMEIRQIMFQRKFNELLDETIHILKDNSDIEYNEKALKAYFEENS